MESRFDNKDGNNRVADFDGLKRAFGTLAAAARVLGMSPQGLNDARKRGNLPKSRVMEQRNALLRHGVEADWSLWGVDAPEDA